MAPAAVRLSRTKTARWPLSPKTAWRRLKLLSLVQLSPCQQTLSNVLFFSPLLLVSLVSKNLGGSVCLENFSGSLRTACRLSFSVPELLCWNISEIPQVVGGDGEHHTSAGSPRGSIRDSFHWETELLCVWEERVWIRPGSSNNMICVFF